MNQDYDNFVRNGLKRPVVEVDSIMLTPENIAEENPKAGLRSGFKEGTVFKKLGDSENEYIVKNKQYAFPEYNLPYLLGDDETPNEGEIVRTFSHLIRKDGKPIVISPEERNVAIFYIDPNNNKK